MKFGEYNLGLFDRGIRAALGIILLLTFAVKPNSIYNLDPYSMVTLILAVALIGSASLGTCGLYTLLGFNTLGKEKAAAPSRAKAARKSRRKKGKKRK